MLQFTLQLSWARHIKHRSVTFEERVIQLFERQMRRKQTYEPLPAAEVWVRYADQFAEMMGF